MRPSDSVGKPLSEEGQAESGMPAFSPLYRQIKRLLMQRLQARLWRPGEAIPSEMELSQQLGVSQGTVRKAIDELATEHLLVRRQGKGTFVATHEEHELRYRFLRLRPDGESRQEQTRAQRTLLSFGRERAGAGLAALLELTAQDFVVHIRRTLALHGSVPVLEDIWLPADAFEGIHAEQVASYEGPTYALLEKEFGVHMVRAVEKLKAVTPPDAGVAAVLGVADNTPLLMVERVAYTYNDRPMELRRGFYCTDRHHYLSELN